MLALVGRKQKELVKIKSKIIVFDSISTFFVQINVIEVLNQPPKGAPGSRNGSKSSKNSKTNRSKNVLYQESKVEKTKCQTSTLMSTKVTTERIEKTTRNGRSAGSSRQELVDPDEMRMKERNRKKREEKK